MDCSKLRKQDMEYGLDEVQKELFDVWKKELPPIIAREKIGHFLGGLIKPSSLASKESRGQGPDEAYRIGRRIAYKRDSFLLWFIKNHEIARITRASDL